MSKSARASSRRHRDLDYALREALLTAEEIGKVAQPERREFPEIFEAEHLSLHGMLGDEPMLVALGWLVRMYPLARASEHMQLLTAICSEWPGDEDDPAYAARVLNEASLVWDEPQPQFSVPLKWALLGAMAMSGLGAYAVSRYFRARGKP